MSEGCSIHAKRPAGEDRPWCSQEGTTCTVLGISLSAANTRVMPADEWQTEETSASTC